jgi:hypothetical protein
VHWIHTAQDKKRKRICVNTVINIRLPSNAGIAWLTERTMSFSTGTLLHAVSSFVS